MLEMDGASVGTSAKPDTKLACILRRDSRAAYLTLELILYLLELEETFYLPTLEWPFLLIDCT